MQGCASGAGNAPAAGHVSRTLRLGAPPQCLVLLPPLLRAHLLRQPAAGQQVLQLVGVQQANAAPRRSGSRSGLSSRGGRVHAGEGGGGGGAPRAGGAGQRACGGLQGAQRPRGAAQLPRRGGASGGVIVARGGLHERASMRAWQVSAVRGQLGSGCGAVAPSGDAQTSRCQSPPPARASPACADAIGVAISVLDTPRCVTACAPACAPAACSPQGGPRRALPIPARTLRAQLGARKFARTLRQLFWLRERHRAVRSSSVQLLPRPSPAVERGGTQRSGGASARTVGLRRPGDGGRYSVGFCVTHALAGIAPIPAIPLRGTHPVECCQLKCVQHLPVCAKGIGGIVHGGDVLSLSELA